jgi:hypothetical protein
MLRTACSILFLLFWGVACRSPLEEREFFTVSLDRPIFNNNLKRLPLKANIGGLSEQVNGCGFYWSTADTALANPVKNKAESIKASPPTNSSSFEASFDALQPGGIFYFRAFAEFKGRTVLSDEIRSFSLDQIVTQSDRPAEVYNDTAFVYGRTVGIEKFSPFVRKHGHVFSATVRVPVLDQPGCASTNLGEKRKDEVFRDSLFPLQFNTTYYYRAYVVDIAGNVYHSERIDSIPIRDGWKRVSDFPTVFKDASVAVWQDQAFVGFGCAELSNCIEDDLSGNIRNYQPSNNRWTEATTLRGSPRTNASMFTIGDTIYLCGGEVTTEGGEISLLPDFWKYVPAQRVWARGNLPTALQRTQAVAFAVGGKGYVGSGLIKNEKEELAKYLNDFWEYNPANGRWRIVAPLPLDLEGSNMPLLNIGRAKAIAFSIGPLGYAGGGQNSSHLPDFWSFTPPTSTTDLGKWTYIGTLPGTLRTEGVAFAIGNKGYYGTGFSYERGHLRDFHEFEPGKGWRTRTVLPGVARERAFGFGAGNRGYLGTGFRFKERDVKGFIIIEVLRDMWQYIPEQ